MSKAETILLVEDDPGLRAVVKLYLEHAGYNVFEATNGLDAMYICSKYEGTIHLLFTDVEMSPMSGPELAEQLLEQHPETQILFMSGNHSEDEMLRGISEMDAHFLGKPFNPKILGQMVKDVLSAA